MENTLSLKCNILAGYKNCSRAECNFGSEGLPEIKSFFVTHIHEASKFLYNFFYADKNDIDKKLLNELTPAVNKVDNIIKQKDFLNVNEKQVPTITGLKLNLIDTYSTLSIMCRGIEKDFINLLNSVSITAGKILSSKDSREAMAQDIKLKNDLDAFKNKLNETLDKLVDSTKNQDRDRIDFLIPNLGSLRVVSENAIALGKYLSTDNFDKKVHLNKIMDISKKIGLITQQVNKTDDFVMSKESIGQLSIVIDFTAEIVTTVQMINMLCYEYIGCFINLVKAVESKSSGSENLFTYESLLASYDGIKNKETIVRLLTELKLKNKDFLEAL